MKILHRPGLLLPALLLPALLVLAGCASDPANPRAPDLTGGPSAPVGPKEACTVTRIIDGDTLHCEPVGRIRFIGMDTPERAQEPFGRRATEALVGMVPVGSDVLVEGDVEAVDGYDRILGYVWHEGLMVNWALVRMGYALVLTYPPNVRWVDAFTAAQAAAREDGVGLWAEDGFECTPLDFRAGRCGG